MLKRINLVLLVSLIVFVFSCKPQSDKTTLLVSWDTAVLDVNGGETSITGDVLVPKDNRTFLKVGTVENGKIDLMLIDYDSVENANTLYSKIELGFPNIKITPEDTAWVELNNSRDFIISTGGKEGDYTLELRDQLGIVKVVLVYFTKNVTIKGNGTYDTFSGGVAYDIDIRASKGWNMIYVKKSNNNVSMKTSEKNIKNIKWFASK